MDRLNQLRGGGPSSSRDSSVDGSGAGDSFLTANETPSKYYSLSEDDSFDNDITKDVSLASTSAESTVNASDCFPNLSPIGKIDYKIGKQIEAANILSGGVNIFDDNENSYDGNELVIDDNVETDKSPNFKSPENSALSFQDDVDNATNSKTLQNTAILPYEVKSGDNAPNTKLSMGSDAPLQDKVELSSDLKSTEAEIPTAKVDEPMEIIEELVDTTDTLKHIDPPLNLPTPLLDQLDTPFEEVVEASIPINGEELAEIAHLPLEADTAEANLPNDNGEASLPNDNGEQVADNNPEEDRTEVVLQIDGNNVAAISIGTGLYLYRKEGQDELAAVQIVKEPQEEEPSFKFLKVRENAEGNLEVYEEIQEVVVVPQETPAKEAKPAPTTPSTSKADGHKPAICEPGTSKVAESKDTTPENTAPVASTSKQDNEPNKETQAERNVNGKMVKISESRKSPLVVHSTPNKEGIPLTKTMVDQQLHPNRHSDNIKKTIEVHTDSCKKTSDSPSTSKSKEVASPEKATDEALPIEKPIDKEISDRQHNSITRKEIKPDVIEKETNKVAGSSYATASDKVEAARRKEDDAKVLMIGKLMESVKVPFVSNEEKRKKAELGDKSKKSETENPSASEYIGTPITNVSQKDKIEDKQPLSPKQLTNTKTDAKETKISGLPPLVELPMKIDTLEDKTQENEKCKDKPLSPPIEIIESDMEVDEDVLVIEEQIIESQPSIFESKKPEVFTVVPAIEIKSYIIDSQIKNVLGTGEYNPTTSIENQIKTVETAKTSTPSKIDTTETNMHPKIVASTPKPTKNVNTNIINTDKYRIGNQPGIEGKTSSFNKKEDDGVNAKDTQSSHNSKISQNARVEERPTDKLVQNIGKSSNAKVPGPIKPIEKNSTETKSVGPMIPPRINYLVNNIHNKPDNKMSKLESKDKPIEKKEAIPVAETREVHKQPSLLSNQATNTKPINTPKLVQPQVKTDIKAAVTTATDTKKGVNHKLLINAVESKPKVINNNHAPVPFGQWTETHRQDFLNKIKESKPVNTHNANQIKQPNDLNRRDVLKKIDSQRQTYNANAKIQESLNKNVKGEAFASKTVPTTITKPEPKGAVKPEAPLVKAKPIIEKKSVQEQVQNVTSEIIVANASSTSFDLRRREINNQEIINKTVEGIINRAVTGTSTVDVKLTITDKPSVEKVDKKPEQKSKNEPSLLDAIEMKMNELHGIPFVERPPHELPRPYVTESKISPKPEVHTIPQKTIKIPNLLPLTKSQQKRDDEVINLDVKEKSSISSLSFSKPVEKSVLKPNPTPEANTSKDHIITENDFDKFARRNSITYENCLTVTDSHQVIQTVVPKEAPPKKISRNEQMLAEAKAKSPHKHLPVKQYHPSKASTKYIPVETNKQYQSKLQMAYQTAVTANVKRRIDSPITIIEDKPVKVVYLDSNVSEFKSAQLNVQGRDLSPAKRVPEPDAVTVGTGDSLDSDILDAIDDIRHDEVKTKSKHQRKQVLTPVETPDLELIEPGDLGIEVSPKKKRKIEDKPERRQNLVPKKSYLLGRATPAEEPNEVRPNLAPIVHNDAVSSIDNLVKAAELLEKQSEIMNVSVQSVHSSQSSTPVKRGRGRPRKNPLPDAAGNTAVSPQKKPRLIDARRPKSISSSDDDSSDDSMIKENWTMGKINEKIVCPICNKLFRSENVVFKHVKHCSEPSPSRSDSGKRSPRRSRESETKSGESETKSRESEIKSRESETKSRESETKSRESETKSRESARSRDSRQDLEEEDQSPVRKTPNKRKSKDSGKSSSSDDVIPIEEPKESEELTKKSEPRKTIKPKLNPNASNLTCEICGKRFRQLSYLVSHKLQHKKDEKKPANESQSTEKTVFGCETCKKEFRKLHHLVQHRLIHNPVQSRALRKTSSEQKDVPKTQETSKLYDPSAGFRCEPCDKSFRKLHHLVEHRETHDGINRQRSNSTTQVSTEKEKPTPPPQCEICKKTFRKLHHLIEHKEQHLETSSEKSDDQKSVKSALSTKDIIHECNLCYMVFPNEHSLTKHTVICLRKKRQSAAKKAAAQEEKTAEESTTSDLPEESKIETDKEPKLAETRVEEKVEKPPEKPIDPPAKPEIPQTEEKPLKPATIKTVEKIEKPIEPIEVENKLPPPETPILKVAKTVETPAKTKQIEEIIVIEDTPKKKTPIKDKVAPSVTKRQKVAPSTEEPTAPSTDEDEVRYMFNPDFNVEETTESKTFTKIRAKKRNSLQFEKPHKDVVRRRSLLQHPPKIPRRAIVDDVSQPVSKPIIKPTVVVEVPSTDSDDSDVKYSFPKTIPEKPEKQETLVEQPKRRKTMAEKRKSLSGIAKRKSLGKAIVKAAAKPSPAKPIKRRTLGVEHRCDCGQLFSSAALLARHASLAHTPPRLRRARAASPAPAAPGPAPAAPGPGPAPARASRPPAPARPRSQQQGNKTVVSKKNIDQLRKSVEQPGKSQPKLRKSVASGKSVETKRKSVEQAGKSVQPKRKSVEQTVKSVETKRRSVVQSGKTVERKRKSVERPKKPDQARKNVERPKTPEQARKNVEQPKTPEQARKNVEQPKKSVKEGSEQKNTVNVNYSVRKSASKTASARSRVHTGIPFPEKRPSKK